MELPAGWIWIEQAPPWWGGRRWDNFVACAYMLDEDDGHYWVVVGDALGGTLSVYSSEHADEGSADDEHVAPQDTGSAPIDVVLAVIKRARGS